MNKVPVPSTLTPDALVERWSDWLDFTKSEAIDFYITRRNFENIGVMFRTNAELKSVSGDIERWQMELHRSHFLVCVRRELEQGGGHPTLMNLLHELEQFSESVLTRARYVALYEDSSLKGNGVADRHFDQKVGAMCKLPRTDPAQDCISSDSMIEARSRLQRKAKKVLSYANWHVLHRTMQPPSNITWREVYEVMDSIFDTYRRLYNLVTASSYVGRYPMPQYDILAPYRMTWLTADFQAWEPPDE